MAVVSNVPGHPERRLEWGVLPLPVFRLMTVMAEKAEHWSGLSQPEQWPEPGKPVDISPFMLGLLESNQNSIDAHVDLRALMTAYVREFHDPRPNLRAVAAAQRVSPTGLPRRYNSQTVKAVGQLLSAKPDISIIVDAFDSIAPEDLRGCSEDIDRALDALKG
jgi:hypothetical protein